MEHRNTINSTTSTNGTGPNPGQLEGKGKVMEHRNL